MHREFREVTPVAPAVGGADGKHPVAGDQSEPYKLHCAASDVDIWSAGVDIGVPGALRAADVDLLDWAPIQIGTA